MSEYDEEHEHDETCQPVWPWSAWEVPTIAARVLGGIFATIGQGFGLLAIELQAAANHNRIERQERAAEQMQARERAQAAADLARLVNGEEE